MLQLSVCRDIEHLGSLESNQESPLSCSPNFQHAQYLDIHTLTNELIVLEHYQRNVRQFTPQTSKYTVHRFDLSSPLMKTFVSWIFHYGDWWKQNTQPMVKCLRGSAVKGPVHISHITLFVLFIGYESFSCDIKHSKQWPHIAVVEYARVVSLHCSRIF